MNHTYGRGRKKRSVYQVIKNLIGRLHRTSESTELYSRFVSNELASIIVVAKHTEGYAKVIGAIKKQEKDLVVLQDFRGIWNER